MKTLKLLFILLAFTVTGVAQQTSWPVINYGTTANDHTGDNLRAATIKEVQTFDILRARMGPFRGSKYLDLQLAIEYFVISYMNQTNMFYVSKVNAGVYTMGQYVYSVEISKVAAYGSTFGYIVMKYSLSTSSLKTGKELIMIPEANSSGLYGSMGINWDLLQTGTQYTCSTWNEGGLYAVNTVTYSPGGDPGGGPVGMPADTSQIINGSQGLYLCHSLSEDITLTVSTTAGVERGFRVKNNSKTYNVKLQGQDNATIEDVLYVNLPPYGWADILFDAENSNLIITGGNFTIPE